MRKPTEMLRHYTRPEQVPQTIANPVEHDLLMSLRHEAARRDAPVPRFVHDLPKVIVTERLTTAILDGWSFRC